MPKAAFSMYSTKEWQDPPDMGEYFEIPVMAITETEQKTEERRWRAEKDLHDTFLNVRTAVRDCLERVINPAYHTSGAAGIA